MKTIRYRLDFIDSLKNIKMNSFSKAETAAFHGRKVIEGIAFGCLVAVQNGLKSVPRDAKGQWNAEKILKSLISKDITIFPSPSIRRKATESEKQRNKVSIVIEGVKERRITHDEFISIYQSLHRWLHEINPYTNVGNNSFLERHEHSLWENLQKIDQFIDKHFISISGEGFFCVLRDNVDSYTKIIPLSKIGELR
ncbi:MAG: hypothetical protein PVJ60_00360 [Phycisphaerales bacterium]